MWGSYFKQHLVTVALLLILTFVVMVDSKYKGIDTKMNGRLEYQTCRNRCDGDYKICGLAALTYKRRFKCLSEREKCIRNCGRRFDSERLI